MGIFDMDDDDPRKHKMTSPVLGQYPHPGNHTYDRAPQQHQAPPPPPGFAPPINADMPSTMQPQSSNWMAPPMGGNANCPPGLEYLTTVDQLLVKQKVELLEAFTGFETNNKYAIVNAMGQQAYFAAEDNDCCTRQCCGKSRPFDMQIVDNAGREVIHVSRPLRCSACCYPCCLQKMEVCAPPGSPIGFVEQQWSICVPKYRILDRERRTVLRIEGPFCTCSLCGEVEFKVLDASGDNQVGMISKKWSGLAKEYFTDADNFGVQFPGDLDVHVKATLLGAVFMIDFMFFEDSGNKKRHDGPGMWS